MVIFKCFLYRDHGESPFVVKSQSPAPTIEEPYRISVKGWLSKGDKHNDYEDNGEPPAVFNVLDTVLVDTMERLKKSRSVYVVD